MAFTGQTKYGYTDGEQIGNWGTGFPAFIRIKPNETPYVVFREDNANHPTPGRFGSMFFASRDFLKQTIFGLNKSDGDLFADKPHNVQDTSEPGSSFVLKDNSTLLFRRPESSGTTPVVTNPTTTPVVTNPTTTTPVTTTPTTTVPTAGLTTTPTTTTSTTTTLNPSTMTPTVKWAIIGVAVAIVGAILFMALKGSNGNANYGARRGNGRRY